jgi:hypothetical protein
MWNHFVFESLRRRLERERIDAAFAAMADDPEYLAETPGTRSSPRAARYLSRPSRR